MQRESVINKSSYLWLTWAWVHSVIQKYRHIEKEHVSEREGINLCRKHSASGHDLNSLIFFGSFQAGLISFFLKLFTFLILAKLKHHSYLRWGLINEHFPPLLSDYRSDVNIYYIWFADGKEWHLPGEKFKTTLTGDEPSHWHAGTRYVIRKKEATTGEAKAQSYFFLSLYHNPHHITLSFLATPVRAS